MRTTSTRSTMPPRSSGSYCSLVRRSICTVTAEYGLRYSITGLLSNVRRDGKYMQTRECSTYTSAKHLSLRVSAAVVPY